MEHEQPGQAPVSGATPSVAGRHALVLSGGGARAAYQVGVLRAVSELLPDKDRNPFPILCGTSAGSLNAAALACLANDFGGAVSRLDQVWGNFHAGQVYRADPLGICLSGARWLSALMFGWLGRHPPRSLLDNTPLRKLLSDALDFERIGKSIASGALYAVAVTASGYVSGESICFVEGEESLEMWRRSQRASARVKLSVEHLMASSAIPFIFPANLVNREYFGDGSMRQTAPISPAIHLGADRILVVGCGFRPTEGERTIDRRYPSLAQIAGHAMASIFLDSLYTDLERLERINRTLQIIPTEIKKRSGLPLRPIEALVIEPSQRLDHLAAEHVHSLPWPVRWLLRGIGGTSQRGSALASYLLFEGTYTRALMALGYADAMKRREELQRFLEKRGSESSFGEAETRL
jgi:NTE family protein